MSTRDDSPSSRGHSARSLLAWLPVALGVLAGLPVLLDGALYDDELLIFSNPFAQSLRYLPENLSRDFFYSAAGQAIGYYRPATKLLFMLEYQLCGARPFGYHALSLGAFGLVIWLGQRLTRSLGFSQRMAALAMCLFATHPASARTVATIASQSDLMCLAGMLACLGAYLRFRRGGARSWLALALLCETLALAFKETALVLPALLLVWERTASSRVARSWWTSLAPVLAYAGLRAALGVLPIDTQDEAQAGALGAAAKLAVSALLRVFVPLGWNPVLHTDRPSAELGVQLSWGVPALGLLGASAFVWVRWPRQRMSLALIWLPTALIIAGAGAIHISEDRQALVLSDRWLLVPALGACWMLGAALDALLTQLARPPLRAAVSIGVAGLLAIQVLVTAEENASYRNENARLLHLAELYRESPDPPHDAREVMLAADAIRAELKGDTAGAVRAHAALLALEPEDSVRRYNLAHALLQAGDLHAALAQAQLAFHGRALDGSQPYPENDSSTRRRAEKALLLGLILERLGERDAAAHYFETSIELNPDAPLAHTRLEQLRRQKLESELRSTRNP